MQLERHESGHGYIDRGDPGEPNVGLPRISVSDLEASILSVLAYDATVIEIGTGLGISTAALARYAHTVWTYDIDPWVRETVWPELFKHHRNIETIDSLDDLGDGGKRQWVAADMVFIDGDHDTDAVRRDIAWAKAHLHHPALIIVHDANYENVNLAFDGDDWVTIPTFNGIGLLVVNVDERYR